jgi:hypothetical protein
MEMNMRINTTKSIGTANAVHDRYGSWHAAKTASTQRDGKFVVASNSAKADAAPKNPAVTPKGAAGSPLNAPKPAGPRK